jgi:threonyl-tRNA synthetase
VIIPIADRHLEYAREIETELKGCGIRVQVDDRSERMNLKIREAQMNKVPYMLVIGDKEIASSRISLRLRNGEDAGSAAIADFINRVKSIVEAKSPDEL